MARVFEATIRYTDLEATNDMSLDACSRALKEDGLEEVGWIVEVKVLSFKEVIPDAT